jgi:hypothetical protein
LLDTAEQAWAAGAHRVSVATTAAETRLWPSRDRVEERRGTREGGDGGTWTGRDGRWHTLAGTRLNLPNLAKAHEGLLWTDDCESGMDADHTCVCTQCERTSCHTHTHVHHHPATRGLSCALHCVGLKSRALRFRTHIRNSCNTPPTPDRTHTAHPRTGVPARPRRRAHAERIM